MRSGRPRTPAPACGYPDHEGDRYIANAARGLVNVSLDFVSQNGQTRYRRKHILKVCMTCMDKYTSKLDGVVGEQMSLDALLEVTSP